MIAVHMEANKRKSLTSRLKSMSRWLVPGLGVKRWLALVTIGTTMVAVGIAIYLIDFYRTAPESWWLPYLSYLSLRFIDRPYRVLIFAGLGIGSIALGIIRLNRSIVIPFLRPGEPLVDTVTRYRQKDRGPRVVVIGGGQGQSTLLRGLKKYTHNLTAIVTVADDGGSSGRLRDSMGILPPGDIRNCLAALSNDEDLITQLFQYRFANNGGELEGHSFGNLFISALSEITGSFEEAVAESGQVLSVYGQVLPSTLHDVRLVADKALPNIPIEVRVKGESRIPQVVGEVRRLWLEPNNPPAFPAAVGALLKADMIIIGPGSLYTSILPNLLVPDIISAIQSSPALKIFICNVATQPGETDGYSCGDHIAAIETHVGRDLFDLVVSNNSFPGELPSGVGWVLANQDLDQSYAVYRSDLVDWDSPSKHDAEKLARSLIDIYLERTGPLAV
ncbi:MAG: YvcK family protein [Anaerolineae bacterium]|nr:YvcK family protein [Anaerolineae bacterium]